MLSTKDNLLLMLNGEVPEYIPGYDIFWGILGSPPFLMKEANPDGSGIDVFGVEWLVGENPTGAGMPKPYDFILDDITKWRDVIKVPDFSDFDWEAAAKGFRDNWDPDLPVAGGVGPSVGYFQALVSFMGFDNGLCAIYEEPEEVKALMDYLCTWAEDLNKKYLHYYKPDYAWFGDDIAHERNPFVSLEQFQDCFAPYWARFCKIYVDAGVPIVHHNCGHFELFLDDLVAMGVNAWEPVQASNDVFAIKEKFGNKLALIEAYDTRTVRFEDEGIAEDDITEELVRSMFRDHVTKLAEGGGFAFFNGDPEMNGAATAIEKLRTSWCIDEFEKFRYDFYK